MADPLRGLSRDHQEERRWWKSRCPVCHQFNCTVKTSDKKSECFAGHPNCIVEVHRTQGREYKQLHRFEAGTVSQSWLEGRLEMREYLYADHGPKSERLLQHVEDLVSRVLVAWVRGVRRRPAKANHECGFTTEEILLGITDEGVLYRTDTIREALRSLQSQNRLRVVTTDGDRRYLPHSEPIDDTKKNRFRKEPGVDSRAVALLLELGEDRPPTKKAFAKILGVDPSCLTPTKAPNFHLLWKTPSRSPPRDSVDE